jgi:hypothetical protein
MHPSPNRLQPLQLTPYAGRTTPQRDFGQFLSQAAGTISSVVDLSMRAAVPGGIASGVSLATGAVRQVAGLTSTPASMNQVAPLTVPSSGPAPGFGAPAPQSGMRPSLPASSGPGEMLETQRLMQLESFAFNQQYLQLQSEMQRESRQFTAVSNVMKVRHDSAKASINNVR